MLHAMFKPAFPSSPFTTSHASLQTQGYTRTSSTSTDTLGLEGRGLLSGSVLTYVVYDQQGPPPNACFETAIHHAASLLVAVSTRTDAAQPHWSDMTYLQWTNPAFDGAPRALNVVLRWRIENADTLAIIACVVEDYKMGAAYDGALPVRGITWDMQTEAAKALLGTPNGSGVAWLLPQHRERLGWRVVQRVEVLWGNDGVLERPSLVFRLKDGHGEV
jgi:hypothetical protein